MPKDKTENHKKIIASAQKEFMTYGFISIFPARKKCLQR